MKRLSTRLKIGFFVSVILVLCINFWWNYYPERWSLGYEFGQLSSNFLLAYISAYVFYYLITIQYNRIWNKNVGGTIFKLSQQLIANGKDVKFFFSEILNIENSDDLNIWKNIARTKIEKVNFIKLTEYFDTSTGSIMTYLQIIIHRQEKINSIIDSIVFFHTYFDPEFLGLLLRLKNSELSFLLHNRKPINIEGIEDGYINYLTEEEIDIIVQYFSELNKIEKYALGNFKKYHETSTEI